jgi:hypothetical protein
MAGVRPLKQRFRYHLPGQLAGDFLCTFDPADDRTKTLHLEVALEDILQYNEPEVCVTCLQRYIAQLSKELKT